MTLKPLDGNSATVNADRRETERERADVLCRMNNRQQHKESKLMLLRADPVPAGPSNPSRHQQLFLTHSFCLLICESQFYALFFSPGKEITILFGIDLLHHRFIPNQQQLCKTAALSNLPASVIYRLWDLIKGLQWERFELNCLMRFQISFFPVLHFFS